MSELPLVAVAPGMSFAEVAGVSTMPLGAPLPDNSEFTAVQPDGPHRLWFAAERHPFELPAGRFTIIDFTKGLVTMVRSSPQLEYLSWDGVVELSRGVEGILRRAGWSRVLPDHDGPLEPEPDDGHALAAILRTEAWQADLRLRRVYEATSPVAQMLGLEHDAWLLTVTIATGD